MIEQRAWCMGQRDLNAEYRPSVVKYNGTMAWHA